MLIACPSTLWADVRDEILRYQNPPILLLTEALARHIQRSTIYGSSLRSSFASP